MPRRPRPASSQVKPTPSPTRTPPPEASSAETPPAPPSDSSTRRLLVPLAVLFLLGLQYALAARSLVLENPTVDEIAHMPAGITYWQKRTFRLYPHNPPLSKLVAALPVLPLAPKTDIVYQQTSWTGDPPSQATFGQSFAYVNADRYFELFNAARLVMPSFALLGGLFVFLWSRRLYGDLGGLLSLSIWCLCPNILAHGRLVTSDVGGAAMCLASTYVFWRFLHRPGLAWAVAAGIALGLAQLTKFSLLLLFGLWPLLWLAKLVADGRSAIDAQRLIREAGLGFLILALSVLTINIGYGFEGTGIPLGKFDFISKTLTRELNEVRPPKATRNELVAMASQHRENRFRGTFLEHLPTPFPKYYVSGFDEQKIESEGLPAWWQDPSRPKSEISGYPVYLNGTMRQRGWWYYYLATLAYKLPEGTWVLLILSFVALIPRIRRGEWFDEASVLSVPVLVLFAMSALTDINLGLRYILPVLPFLYVGLGRIVPWIESRAGSVRKVAAGVAIASVGLSAAACLTIHPHYLAYFNQVAGGPSRGREHLIDSNLDWGQDLVGLQKWMEKHRPGGTVGLAYFGQINPSIFFLREQPFRWFLPPARPGKMVPMPGSVGASGPIRKLVPGLYAVSASLTKGLPWRVYDPALPPAQVWGASWNATRDSFSYFDGEKPIDSIGHSILIYELDAAACDRLNQSLGLK